jgi:hypothetical protein
MEAYSGPSVVLSEPAPTFVAFVNRQINLQVYKSTKITPSEVSGLFFQYCWEYFPHRISLCVDEMILRAEKIVETGDNAVKQATDPAARKSAIGTTIGSFQGLINELDGIGKAVGAKYEADRLGKQALRKEESKGEKKEKEESIDGKRVRHYTNKHTMPLIIKSSSLIVSKDSDQGSIFLMHKGHFQDLDNMKPGDIKLAFDIRSQNECQCYVEFNLEDSRHTKSRNDHIKIGDKKEVVLKSAVENMHRREPAWYSYNSGKWEFVPGPHAWGEG